MPARSIGQGKREGRERERKKEQTMKETSDSNKVIHTRTFVYIEEG